MVKCNDVFIYKPENVGCQFIGEDRATQSVRLLMRLCYRLRRLAWLDGNRPLHVTALSSPARSRLVAAPFHGAVAARLRKDRPLAPRSVMMRTRLHPAGMSA